MLHPGINDLSLDSVFDDFIKNDNFLSIVTDEVVAEEKPVVKEESVKEPSVELGSEKVENDYNYNNFNKKKRGRPSKNN